MSNHAHLAELVRSRSHLAPGSLEEADALGRIDAAREDELAARDRVRVRRDWRRRVARSVRDARGTT